MKHPETLIILLFIAYFFIVSGVWAFESGSDNFEIHGAAIGSIFGRSTSTNYINQSAGGQNAIGYSTSTARGIYSGILYWLMGIFTPKYEQIHYRWRNDDGNEVNATWAANEDTGLTIAQNTVKRLRFAISNEGWTREGGQSFRIEYASTTDCANGSYVAIPTDSNLAWQVVTSAYLTDGEPTTNVPGGLTDENAAFVAGQVKTTGNQTSPISLTSENFTEIEYVLKATDNVINNGGYCFRLTNAGSTTNFVYTVYARATTTLQSITLELSTSTVVLGTLIPGMAITATSTATVTVSGLSAGYSLKVKRDDATSTLDLINNPSIDFPDYTAWDPTGNGNATTTPGATFSFRVQQTGTNSNYSTTWWGASDLDGTAKYGGFPPVSQTIMNCNIGGNCNNGITNTQIKYRANSPLTQEIGNYDGTITYTALINL